MTLDIMETFTDLHQKGTTIVFATQFTGLVKRYSYRVVRISNGQILNERKGDITQVRGEIRGMMFFLQYVIRRTFQNMMGNLFPNFITISIIVISMLIFSTFTLIAFNLTNLLKIWEDKIEIIAYLKQGTSSREVEPLLNKTRLLEGVELVRYVSPYDAMDFMAAKLGRQKSLLQGIQPALLPPSFEIQLKERVSNSTKIKRGGHSFGEDSSVRGNSIWPRVGRDISVLVHILRLTQWILGGLLLIGIVFITSNTLQLTISSRRKRLRSCTGWGQALALSESPFIWKDCFKASSEGD